MSDAAIVSIVTAVVTIATLWIRSAYGQKAVEDKIADNTELTKKGTAAAAVNAKKAADAATDMSKKLNGGIDEAIREAVAPIRKALEEHAAQDRHDLAEVQRKFDDLSAYVHQRNHDLLDAISPLSYKLDILLQQRKPGEGAGHE